MLDRFVWATLLFHFGIGLSVIVLGRRWVRERVWKRTPPAWCAALVRDAAHFGIALFVFALMAGGVAPARLSLPFTVMRFLCQGLFGEGIALAGFAAALHFRQGAVGRGALLATLTGLLLLVYFEAYHRGPRSLQVRRHTVDASQGRAGAGVLRILHLSDLQTHAIGAYEERALRKARQQGADLIILTGDYIQERLAPTGARAARDFAVLLQREGPRAPLGVFAVSGDVEGEGWEQMVTGSGVTLLDNRSARIPLPGGRSLALIGLDVEMSRGDNLPGLLQIVDTAPAGDLRVVMGHRPDFVRALAGRRKIDLALAGHTHGGQVVLPFVGPLITLSRLPRRYAGGLHDYEGIPLHVSRGIGMERGVAPQIRFLCPPEICVLEVRY